MLLSLALAAAMTAHVQIPHKISPGTQGPFVYGCDAGYTLYWRVSNFDGQLHEMPGWVKSAQQTSDRPIERIGNARPLCVSGDPKGLK